MKKVELSGGMGNQLFQFSFAYHLSLATDSKILLNSLSYNNDPLRELELEKIIDFSKLDNLLIVNEEVSIFSKLTYKFSKFFKKPLLNHYWENDLTYKHDLPFSKINALKGYWQSPKYFDKYRSDILSFISLENSISNDVSLYLGEIERDNSVSLHIRRGDYVENNEALKVHGNVCDDMYYREAISKVKTDDKDKQFFIFSDDLEWCKENFKWLDNKTLVQTNSHFDDLYLMSKCRDNIIANSTFSWWGAYLNERDGLRIAPKKWFNDDRAIDIYPKGWYLL
ncbi:putative O-antigen biosynthesis glycosyltransferase WbnK [Vibrio chagasii]|nr:putative O-antigen biosynthesis glycosyltransferase WbnK [Vibrio chagasii]CAH6896529.1 putative O-antigen biosynthesis glycosyltransferase WbnK [Vibrio chagasii]